MEDHRTTPARSVRHRDRSPPRSPRAAHQCRGARCVGAVVPRRASPLRAAVVAPVDDYVLVEASFLLRCRLPPLVCPANGSAARLRKDISRLKGVLKRFKNNRLGCIRVCRSTLRVAEGVGFEPTRPFSLVIFETTALDQLCDPSLPRLIYHAPTVVAR
jgi:hypothetical protein